ncbi:MAG: nucleotidyltransferase family protein, partial [Desulfuromonadales bacterium]|nr:nucleotidyltransferase family protein [Desulfuromonadales bacterium]
KELRCLVELLNGAGVSVIPYKGPILAEEVYGDLALRSFVDLDLLVPPEQAWDAVQILLKQGYAVPFDLPQQRWSGLQKTDNHIALYHAERDWIVEIHWQLFHPMYVQPFDLSPHWRQLNCGMEERFGREETLVMLCAHGTKHGWSQLKWLVDIDRLVRCGMINWEYALQLAKGSGSTRCLLLGLNLSNNLLGTLLDEVVSEQITKTTVVKTLADNVKSNLFINNPEQKSFLDEYVFYLQSRDNMFDQLKQVLRWLFCPRLADWMVFKWGDYCHALYYVERPMRMFFKHVLRPMFVWSQLKKYKI